MDKRIYEEYFLRVLEEGSITGAAKALEISQPALSKGLNALEAHLGYRVLDRRTTPLSLTAEGRVYHEYLLRSEVLEKDLESRLQAIRSARESEAVIGSPAAYVNSIVAAGAEKLMNHDAGYRVTIRTAALEELINMAGGGEINCFISTTGELPENFESRVIKKEKICMGVPKKIMRLKADTRPVDFDSKPFILPEKWQPLYRAAESFFDMYGIRPESRITTDQVSTAVLLSGHGYGICFASEDTLKETKLQIYPLPMEERNIYIAYDRDLYMPEAGRKLIEALC